MAALQLQGTALWALFEAEGVFVADDLKLILKANRYDDIYSLSNFSDMDRRKCLDFMQNTLHKLPHMKNNEVLMESFYGIFKDSPEQFTFLGGIDKSLKRITVLAKQMAAKSSPSSAARGASEGGSTSSQQSNSISSAPAVNENMTDKIVALKKTLDDNVNGYLKTTYPDAKLSVSAAVVRDNLGSFVSSLPCSFQSCLKTFKITMNRTRWNTSNYYAHMKTHFQVSQNDSTKRNEKGKTALQLYLTQESREASSTKESESSDDVIIQQVKRKSAEGEKEEESNGNKTKSLRVVINSK